jgi:hypothetical protein
MNTLKWNDLAEMHLLLREAGWEVVDEGWIGWRAWVWKHPLQRYAITTSRRNQVAGWSYVGSRRERSTSVLGLKRKLKALSKSVTKSADA